MVLSQCNVHGKNSTILINHVLKCVYSACIYFTLIQNDESQGDLSTLANVVTSLAQMSKTREVMESSIDQSGLESMSTEGASVTEVQPDEQNSSEISQ